MREVEGLRHANDQLTEEVMNLRMRGDRDGRELDSLKKLSREREEDFRRKSDALERRVKELESDLHRTSMQHKVLIEKGNNYREVDESYRQLEIDYRSL
jgi:predicted  nucleic acid-binding Zn-ribbon protein